MFFKMGQLRPLFVFIFGLFKQTLLQLLQQINVKNIMPIQYRALGFEPWPFVHEPPPITTRPEKCFILMQRRNYLAEYPPLHPHCQQLQQNRPRHCRRVSCGL